MDINFTCKHCKQNLTIDEAGAGTTIDCPKCVKPVYVPTKMAAAVLAMPSSSPPSAIQTKDDPASGAVDGAGYCLIIGGVLTIVGGVLVLAGFIFATALFFVGIPFLTAAFACGIYAICKGQTRQGLVIIAVFSLLIGLPMLPSLLIMQKNISEGTRMIQDMQKQSEQIQRMFKP